MEIGGREEVMAVRNRMRWEAFATWSHADVQAWVATKAHIWVCGPTEAIVCVDVYSSCCNQELCGFLNSDGSPGIRLVYKIHALFGPIQI